MYPVPERTSWKEQQIKIFKDVLFVETIVRLDINHTQSYTIDTDHLFVFKFEVNVDIV